MDTITEHYSDMQSHARSNSDESRHLKASIISMGQPGNTTPLGEINVMSPAQNGKRPKAKRKSFVVSDLSVNKTKSMFSFDDD